MKVLLLKFVNKYLIEYLFMVDCVKNRFVNETNGIHSITQRSLCFRTKKDVHVYLLNLLIFSPDVHDQCK